MLAPLEREYFSIIAAFVAAGVQPCVATTHLIPPITLEQFVHQSYPDDLPGVQFVRDYIQFPSDFGPGEGEWDSAGFTSRIVDGDEIIVRVQAPPGRRLTVHHPSNAVQPSLFFFSGEWRSPSGGGMMIPQGASQISWDGLLGPAPTRTNDQTLLGPNAESVGIDQVFQVTSSFQFQAVEVRFNAQNPPAPGTPRSYAPISALISPSVSSQSRVPEGSDPIMIELSPISAETVSIPNVTISQLAHTFFFDSVLNKFRSTDFVDFPNGPGSFTSPGFTASVGQGDSVTARFQAPPGHRFKVVRPAQAETLRLTAEAFFSAFSGQPTTVVPISAVFHGLTGPQPNLMNNDSRITSDGRRFEFDVLFDVPADCAFQALELRFDVQQPIPHLSRTYSGAQSFSSPSFGTIALGSSLTDSIVMSIVPVPVCQGDINADGATNTLDLTVFLGNFGTTVPVGTRGDLNNDGSVTTQDLTILLGGFGCTS